MLKYTIITAIIILELLIAYNLKTAYTNQIDLYNAKIESYLPHDMVKHKRINYRLKAKG